jgi:hypothetical protein
MNQLVATNLVLCAPLRRVFLSNRLIHHRELIYHNMTKICTQCKLNKPLEEFHNSSRNKSGKRHNCKACNSKLGKKWYRDNPDKVIEKRAKYKPIYQARIRFRLANEPDFRQRAKERMKKYRSNPNNKEKIRLRNRLLMRKKLLNPYNRVVANLRRRIPAVLKGETTKSAPTFKLLGCDKNQLMLHLESKFQPGMSWDNYGAGDGKWVVDHILPCASFDLSKPEEQGKCFHYTNLQPLWFKDNILKSDKILISNNDPNKISN